MIRNIKYDSNLLTAIEGENEVVMDRFGKTKLSGLDHNSNDFDHSMSDSKDSVYFRTDHGCSTKVYANANNQGPYVMRCAIW